MRKTTTFCEDEMLLPVLTLFPSESFSRFEQTPLGRKKIDLVCVEHAHPNAVTSVELKIKDWRKALWQAVVNCQVSERSFVAIWHEYAHRVIKAAEILKTYGVGLIVVYKDSAEVILEPRASAKRIARSEKCEWYNRLIQTSKIENK